MSTDNPTTLHKWLPLVVAAVLAIVIAVVYYLLSNVNRTQSDSIVKNAAEIDNIASKTAAEIKAIESSNKTTEEKTAAMAEAIMSSQTAIKSLQQTITENLPKAQKEAESASASASQAAQSLEDTRKFAEQTIVSINQAVANTKESLAIMRDLVASQTEYSKNAATKATADAVATIEELRRVSRDTTNAANAEFAAKIAANTTVTLATMQKIAQDVAVANAETETRITNKLDTTLADINTAHATFGQKIAADLSATLTATTKITTDSKTAMDTQNANFATKLAADMAATGKKLTDSLTAIVAAADAKSATTLATMTKIAQDTAYSASLIADAQVKQNESVAASIAAINADITARNTAAKTAADAAAAATANATAITNLQALTTKIQTAQTDSAALLTKIQTAQTDQNAILTKIQAVQTTTTQLLTDTQAQIKTWQTWRTAQMQADTLNFSFAGTRTLSTLASKYDGKFVHDWNTDEIFLLDMGYKRYVDVANYDGAAFTDLSPSLLAAFPLGQPAVRSVMIGNNGSVTCQQYCQGEWGVGALAANNPAWKGAVAVNNVATPYSATTGGGNCGCYLTNNPRYRWATKAPGNTYTVKTTLGTLPLPCDNYCSTYAQKVLAKAWPDAVGGQLAPGWSAAYQNMPNPADNNSCMCVPAWDEAHIWPAFK